MTTRHPLHDIYALAASDAETSGLSPEDVKARLLELLPSYEGDFDTIINSGGHEWRAGTPHPVQEQAPESSESGPKSFSDQLQDELRAKVAQNQVVPGIGGGVNDHGSLCRSWPSHTPGTATGAGQATLRKE